MKKRCKNSEEKNLLPFHIIKAASEGDVLAIKTKLLIKTLNFKIGN